MRTPFETDHRVKAVFAALDDANVSTFDKLKAIIRAGKIAELYINNLRHPDDYLPCEEPQRDERH